MPPEHNKPLHASEDQDEMKVGISDKIRYCTMVYFHLVHMGIDL